MALKQACSAVKIGKGFSPSVGNAKLMSFLAHRSKWKWDFYFTTTLSFRLGRIDKTTWAMEEGVRWWGGEGERALK